MQAGGAECHQGESHLTMAQEDKEAQFRSAVNRPAQGRTANGLTARRKLDVTQGGARHSEGGVCVAFIQGGLQLNLISASI